MKIHIIIRITYSYKIKSVIIIHNWNLYLIIICNYPITYYINKVISFSNTLLPKNVPKIIIMLTKIIPSKILHGFQDNKTLKSKYNLQLQQATSSLNPILNAEKNRLKLQICGIELVDKSLFFMTPENETCLYMSPPSRYILITTCETKMRWNSRH